MKNAIMFLITLLLACAKVFAADGDFESRLREAELAGDRNAVDAICREWYASGQYSYGLLQWNYNLLMSVEENALLLTQQESDTYPAIMLQHALEVRPDVQLLSFQWLEEPKYRQLLVDRDGYSWIPQDYNLSDFVNKLIQKGVKPIYFGAMTQKNMLKAGQEKLYLTGLALKYSMFPFDNLAVLRNNFENRFHTDYLELNLQPESDQTGVARANLNYIPALLLLHRHYLTAGEAAKATRMQQLAMRIAAAAQKESEVRAFFTPDPPTTMLLTDISPRDLEKGMKKVKGNLFASETELSNRQYEAFLTDLLKNRDFDQLTLCRTSKTDWKSLLPPELQGLPDKVLFEHGHPDGPEFPVQNISYEAAQRYCAWVTQVYNASPDKKKYKKVLFRLPTEEEWMLAARAGRNNVPYPWGGYYVRNAKGCYLGNYFATQPCGDCPAQTHPMTPAGPLADVQKDSSKPITNSNDGGFFPVRVDSYYPNDFGLYAVSGNVAEMIAEPGKTKGGSWRDIEYYGQISTSQQMTGPSPAIGFRVFMEVIEE